MIQSKLMVQLAKEQKDIFRSSFNEQVLEQVYASVCKTELKNLSLTEFLCLAIEKELTKSTGRLEVFMELYEEVKARTIEDTHSNQEQGKFREEAESKFTKNKFIALVKELADKLYGSYRAYETVLFTKLAQSSQELRLKLDDQVKKYLVREGVLALASHSRELQVIFEAYMPENFNSSLAFNMEEIILLQKKLPIICFFRFLCDAEISPQVITPIQFMEITSKLIPASLPNNPNSHKQILFYSPETIANYFRQSICGQQIKLIDGDIGLTFVQFQLLFMRVATEFAKDTVNDFAGNMRKLIAIIKLEELMSNTEQRSTKKSRFQTVVQLHLRVREIQAGKLAIKQKSQRRKIEDLYDTKDDQMKEQEAKNVFRNVSVTSSQLANIKRTLDEELGELLPRKVVQKENEGYFDVQKKHVVIGEQLPKIQQKNKPAESKDIKKTEDPLLGFKPEVPKRVSQAKNMMLQRQKKIRINNEYPILLNEVLYPSNLKSPLNLPSEAEIYLETSYIHLGERLYEQSFRNYCKAKQIVNCKSSPLLQFYFQFHAGQILDSAGRDQVALLYYFRAKEISSSLPMHQVEARALCYISMGSCLFHLAEYEYALRCFCKAKAVFGGSLEIESMNNAVLHNDIGSCLMMLNRNQEAIRYFQISHNILDLKVGCFDQRTLIVQQNGNKNRKAHIQMMPQFKTMWKTYVEKKGLKAALAKPAKGKK